jgi:hypothetical protein
MDEEKLATTDLGRKFALQPFIFRAHFCELALSMLPASLVLAAPRTRSNKVLAVMDELEPKYSEFCLEAQRPELFGPEARQHVVLGRGRAVFHGGGWEEIAN